MEAVVDDSLSVGEAHASFNYATIAALNSVVEDLVFIGEAGHVAGVDERLQAGSTDVGSVQLVRVPMFASRSFVMRATVTQSLAEAMSTSKRDLLRVSLASDNTIVPWVARRVPTSRRIVVAHNNLDAIRGSRRRRRAWTHLAGGRDAQVVALTEAYASRLRHAGVIGVVAVPHPLYPELADGGRSWGLPAEEGVVTIGLFGRHARIALTNPESRRILSGVVRHGRATGIEVRITSSDGTDPNLSGASAFCGDLASRRNWFRAISRCDVIYFPPSQDLLEGRASGVLADALSARVLVVGPRTGHFRELLQGSALSQYLYRADDKEDAERSLCSAIDDAPDVARTMNWGGLYEGLTGDSLAQIWSGVIGR